MEEKNRDAMEEILRYTKKQYRMSVITALFTVIMTAVVTVTAFMLVPKVTKLVADIKRLTEPMEEMMGPIGEAADSMKKVAKNLEEIDFAGMSKDVGDLVVNANESIEEAMKKVESLDIDNLNQSIEELHQVLEPLSKFFNALSGGGSN